MFIPASLEELFGPRVEKNPEWKNAQDTCVHTEDKNHYIKDAGKWYRILKRSETIPENAQFLDVNKWHFTANSGQKQTHSESLYRVPSDGPPIPGGEDKDPLLGDFRWMNLKKNSLGGEVSIGGEEYMREGEQWFRLMKAGEKIPQYAQYSFNGNPVWCQTVLSGEAVDLNHGRSYRVQCDPPHGAFRGPLKPT